MRKKWNPIRSRQLFLILMTGCLFLVFAVCRTWEQPAAASEGTDVESRQAFAEAAKVFFHPRCLNCHPPGNAPTIHDQSAPHRFNVKRGAAGKGIEPLNCNRCHQDVNQPGGRPGAPHWHMPPENMPMVFQGRTPGELCRQLKDPLRNGGRTGEQIIDHIDKDPLVRWAWNPGEGRTVPEMSHETFSAQVHLWLKNGLACPD